MVRSTVFIAAPLALAFALVGCNKDSGSTTSGGAATGPKTATATAEAREVYKTRCATCHGDNGKGDGPGGAALTPKPRNYSDKEWQKTVTDEQIKKTIVQGGAAVGKSPAMPPAPDLDGKPVLDGLVGVVREFGK